MDPLEQYLTLVNSTWSTRDLAAMALVWFDRQTGRIPIWQCIAGTEELARDFYANQPEALVRELAADALVSAGWTLAHINAKRS
jgi:hypothetical protein